MRAVRLFLYALVGVLLGTVSVLAAADTVPALTGQTVTVDARKFWQAAGNTGQSSEVDSFTTAANQEKTRQNCNGALTGVNPEPQYPADMGQYRYAFCEKSPGVIVEIWVRFISRCSVGSLGTWGGSANPGYTCTKTGQTTCPPGGYTLDAGGTTCSKPNTCSAGQSASSPYIAGWRVGSAPGAIVGPTGGSYSAPSSICDGSCTIALSSADSCSSAAAAFVDTPQAITCTGAGSFTGSTCSTKTASTATPPVIPNHAPKCAADEGVMTSSSGTVACVPAGTPSAEKPAVTTTKKVETFGDGSTKTTETTKTTVPSDGTSATTTTTTGTGGQSGAAGSSTAKEATSKESTPTDPSKKSEDDTCDPKSDMCGSPGTGDLYSKKSATVSGVLSTFSDGVKSSPAGAAMTGFFSVSTPGGSCPNWQVTVPVVNVTLNLSQYFCTTEAMNMMNLVGFVLLAVASFVGFRWAIL